MAVNEVALKPSGMKKSAGRLKQDDMVGVMGHSQMNRSGIG